MRNYKQYIAAANAITLRLQMSYAGIRCKTPQIQNNSCGIWNDISITKNNAVQVLSGEHIEQNDTIS